MRVRTLQIATLVLTATGNLSLAADQSGLEAYAAKAREAVKAMGGALQTKLKEAIAAGGPVSAIAVCKTLAPQITETQSKAAGMTIKRTALRVRNPSNAPDELETKVLQDFAKRFAAGADATQVERIEEVNEGGRQLVRYFKAIPMAKEPCLACHGSNLPADLTSTISQLYPEDKATGFAPGDLRGAFSVTMEKPGK